MSKYIRYTRRNISKYKNFTPTAYDSKYIVPRWKLLLNFSIDFCIHWQIGIHNATISSQQPPKQAKIRKAEKRCAKFQQRNGRRIIFWIYPPPLPLTPSSPIPTHHNRLHGARFPANIVCLSVKRAFNKPELRLICILNCSTFFNLLRYKSLVFLSRRTTIQPAHSSLTPPPEPRNLPSIRVVRSPPSPLMIKFWERVIRFGGVAHLPCSHFCVLLFNLENIRSEKSVTFKIREF